MLSFFLMVSLFLFGLIIGSFLNSLIYRLSLPGDSFWNKMVKQKRSYCPHCKHQLASWDLIPVVSFLLLMGKCRYCKDSIALEYPLVELGTAVVFLLIFNVNSQNVLSLCFMLYVSCSMIIILVYDLHHYIIPDIILFPVIVVTLLYQLLTNYDFLLFNSLWAGLILAGCFALLYVVSYGEWMGFGDVKLALLLGFLLGFPNIFPAMFLAFLFGAIIGLVAMLLYGKKLKSQIPFAPFLIIGTWIAMFWGENIIHWYTSLFLIS